MKTPNLLSSSLSKTNKFLFCGYAFSVTIVSGLNSLQSFVTDYSCYSFKHDHCAGTNWKHNNRKRRAVQQHRKLIGSNNKHIRK